MSKRKGVSADEKRDRMLEIFHDSADVFMLKDIEKLAVKKGIISQAVKDVLQALVDDDLVHVEKIGISNYYWSFPSEASVKVETDLLRLRQDVAAAEKRRAELESAVLDSKAGREDMEARAAKLAELRELQRRVSSCQAEAAQYKDNDPETVRDMQRGADLAKTGANRWLDNSWTLQSWCKKRFQGHEVELDGMFKENGLTEEIDYIP
ncbi:MAG: hypothetical protein WDW36_000325 [Sanguina aurantia]